MRNFLSCSNAFLCITTLWYLSGASAPLTVLAGADWDEKLDGGKLCLYHRPTAASDRPAAASDSPSAASDKPTAASDSSQGEQATLIAPAGDTLVVFDSRLEHEVLPSFADR